MVPRSRTGGRSWNVIVGSGVDLIDNQRVARELGLGAWTPEDGIFTRSELDFCNRGKRPALRYAACFGAKEATLKALGIEVINLSIFREVELLQESRTRFVLQLHGRTKSFSQTLGVGHIHVAVATAARLTTVFVVLES